MQLWAIRHTKTDVGEGICYGQTDVGLAENYLHDIEESVLQINNQKFDAIYSSPLKRCSILASRIAQNQKVIFDHRLKELNFGLWELQTWNNIFETSLGKLWMDNYIETPCPEGESYLQLNKRIEEFLFTLKIQHQGSNVLLVTHSGCIVALHAIMRSITAAEAIEKYRPAFGKLVQII